MSIPTRQMLYLLFKKSPYFHINKSRECHSLKEWGNYFVCFEGFPLTCYDCPNCNPSDNGLEAACEDRPGLKSYCLKVMKADDPGLAARVLRKCIYHSETLGSLTGCQEKPKPNTILQCYCDTDFCNGDVTKDIGKREISFQFDL